MNQNDNSWLAKPSTIKTLKVLGIIALIASVIAEFFVHHHAYFGIDGTLGFTVWGTVLTSVGVVLVAAVLGKILRRSEDYYDH